MVALRLRGGLPPALRDQVVEEDPERVVLRLPHPREVGAALEACRSFGSEVEELEVAPADLEDVFLQLMSETAERSVP
jgi:hypothetical protein